MFIYLTRVICMEQEQRNGVPRTRSCVSRNKVTQISSGLVEGQARTSVSGLQGF